MTTGQEMEWVYSYNPGTRTGHLAYIAEHELKLNRTEMSTIRWMCGVKLNKRKKSEELRELLAWNQSV